MKNNNPTGKGGFQDRPQDINLEGAPKRGQTWQESVKRLTDMNRNDLVEYVGGKKTRIGKLLATAADNIPMKDAVIVAALVSFLIDPNPRMFTALSDREEGKPNQPIEIKDELTEDERIARLATLLDAARARRDRQASK